VRSWVAAKAAALSAGDKGFFYKLDKHLFPMLGDTTPPGPIAPLPCLSRTAYRRCADCHSEKSCEVRQVFSDVAQSARLVLDQMTIADAVAGNSADGTRRPHAIRVRTARQAASIARK